MGAQHARFASRTRQCRSLVPSDTPKAQNAYHCGKRRDGAGCFSVVVVVGATGVSWLRRIQLAVKLLAHQLTGLVSPPATL